MKEILQLYKAHIPSPLGEMTIVADDAGNLRALDWTDAEAKTLRGLQRHYGEHGFALHPAAQRHGPTEAIAGALKRYFVGEPDALAAIPVKTGGTAFQREVWRALRTIPRGATRSYAEIARQIGRPKAVRAVGLANGANPISVVVPCHRVIGADGSLTGYGGGLERKRWLLDHEAHGK